MIAFLELIPRWVLLAVVAVLVALAVTLRIEVAHLQTAVAEAKLALSEAEKAVAIANTEAANRAAALQASVVKATRNRSACGCCRCWR